MGILPKFADTAQNRRTFPVRRQLVDLSDVLNNGRRLFLLGIGQGIELGTGIAYTVQRLRNAVLCTLHCIVHVLVCDLAQLLDFGLGLLDHLGGLLLGLEIDIFLGDELTRTLLGLLHHVLGLFFGIGDHFIPGLDDGLCLLELTGKLIADLIQQIQ